MQIQNSTLNYEKYRLINLLASYGIKNQILQAFDVVPRDLFVNKQFAPFAWEDRALPISFGQTTSQPSLIATILQELNIKATDKILEIGTGSGFQTALLSQLAGEVYTIERVEALSQAAKQKVENLRAKNVIFVVNDGTLGLAKYAPYDVIIVSAGFNSVPPALVEQLKDNGKLIMPLGEQHSQILGLFSKKSTNLVMQRKIADVQFVPLIGKFAWKEEDGSNS